MYEMHLLWDFEKGYCFEHYSWEREYLEMNGGLGRAAPNSLYVACQLVNSEERTEK